MFAPSERGRNTITSCRYPTTPVASGASQIGVGESPFRSVRHSLPCMKNATAVPSGDQKGKKASSVPRLCAAPTTPSFPSGHPTGLRWRFSCTGNRWRTLIPNGDSPTPICDAPEARGGSRERQRDRVRALVRRAALPGSGNWGKPRPGLPPAVQNVAGRHLNAGYCGGVFPLVAGTWKSGPPNEGSNTTTLPLPHEPPRASGASQIGVGESPFRSVRQDSPGT